MRKDIYIVSVRNLGTDEVKVSSEGYEKLEDAIRFIEDRSDYPNKERYTLTWRSNVYVYQIHIIKVQ